MSKSHEKKKLEKFIFGPATLAVCSVAPLQFLVAQEPDESAPLAATPQEEVGTEQQSVRADISADLSEHTNTSTDQITPDSRFTEDLGMDSLSMTEYVFSLEEKYGIKIPDEDVAKLNTPKDVENYLKSRGK